MWATVPNPMAHYRFYYRASESETYPSGMRAHLRTVYPTTCLEFIHPRAHGDVVRLKVDNVDLLVPTPRRARLT